MTMSSSLVPHSETAPQDRYPEVQPPADVKWVGQVSRRFWPGFFLPVNILFHGLAYTLLGNELNLDRATLIIVATKTVYLGLVIYAMLALWGVWQASAEGPSARHRGMYLFWGLVSIVVFLAAHSERAYRFGIFEREIRREVVKINSVGSAAQQAEGLLGVRIRERDWYYDFGFPGLLISQIDLVRFKATVSASLVGIVCSDPWTQRLISANIAIHYVFRDRDGQVITDEIFGKDVCAAIY